MFDFPASGQASKVRRRPLLPVATSVAIHAAAVTLVLAFTFSDGIVERPPSPRAMILLALPPVIHPARQTPQRTDRAPPRLFRAPVVRFVTAPRREPAPVPAPQIPLPEVARPLLPTVEVARLPVAPAPPLRIDNLAPLMARAPDPTASAGVVSRSSGFEQIAVQAPPRLRAPPRLGGEFDDATLIPAVQPHRAGTAPAPSRELPVTRSVEILSKPKPAYTEEARRRQIEGEVLLEILFSASGQVRVLGTVRGLGHGLDENAIAAAEAIRFRPAERAGIAADSTAIVHIVFQLAF